MRYKKIDPALFINNRKKLSKLLKPNSLVVLNANDIMPTNADGTMPFCQNSDLFYLSGIDQEETLLVLYPDAPQSAWRKLLFVKETSENIKIWEGEKYTQASATATSGITSVHWLKDFDAFFHTLMSHATCVYLNSNEHARATVEVPTRDARFITRCKEQYPLHQYERLAPLMHQLRPVKSPQEVALIQQACDITGKGIKALLSAVKPGVLEYALEAAMIGEFVRSGSKGFAYEPIVAAGANACILHYTANNQSCQAGDTILIDAGAEYANYKSDLTRVVPVSGCFTPRQRKVYEAVLSVMRYAETILIPGNDLPTYHQQVGEKMTEELLQLGLLSKDEVKNQAPSSPAYKRYFMHGTSHHIGLDTHDVGYVHRKLVPGMVLTIEPGIYIPEEGIGMRLENTYLLEESASKNLMANIPIEVEEIEAWVKREGV